MRRILVTGGFGSLGSHLAESLLESEDLIVEVVDNLSSNPLPLPFLLRELNGADRLRYCTVSVKDFFSKPVSRYDQIYHLASAVGPAGLLDIPGMIAPGIIEDSSLMEGLGGVG